MARYEDVHPVDPQPRIVTRTVDRLREGALVAYPTSSGYALGCTIDNVEGRDRMLRIRHLREDHHFTLLCRDFAQLGQVVDVSNAVFRAVKAATPGPYTFILRATPEVPRRLSHPKKHTVGVRISGDPLAQALLAELGEPLLTTTLILPGEDAPMTEGWIVKTNSTTSSTSSSTPGSAAPNRRRSSTSRPARPRSSATARGMPPRSRSTDPHRCSGTAGEGPSGVNRSPAHDGPVRGVLYPCRSRRLGRDRARP